MTLPIDDLLKMIVKHNAGQAVAQGAKQVLTDTLPKVAKEAVEGVGFVKSLPRQTFAQDTLAQLQRVQSSADATALLQKHTAANFAHIPAEQLVDETRVTQMRDSYGYNTSLLGNAKEQNAAAALDLAEKSMGEVKRLAGEFLDGRPGAREEMLRMFDTGSEYMVQSSGHTGGTGRSFRLLAAGPQGSLEALREAASKDTLLAAKLKTTASLEDFARIAVDIEPTQLMKIANHMQDPSWNGALREFYYNSMLSRVKTQTKNIFGNGFNMLVNVAERYINAGVSTGFGTGLWGSRSVVLSDANNLVKGYWHGFREAMSKAAPAYRGQIDARWQGKSIVDDTRGGEMEQMLGSQFGKTGALVGKYLAAPTKALQASDTFYKEWTYFAELYAESAKRAATSGENFDEVFEQFYRNPTTELTEAARARAETQALVFTHTEDLWNKWENTAGTQDFQGIGRIADALNKAKQGGGPGGWLLTMTMPFVKTSANALRFNLERFPVVNYVFGKYTREAIHGAHGPAARELAIAKSIMGGSVMGMFAIAAANGEITGAAPRDPELRASYLAVHPEYSVNFAGQWLSYDPGSTLGVLLATAANFGAAAGAKTGVEYESMTDAFMWGASLSFAEINDVAPMLEPVGTLMDMMGNGDYPSDEKLTNPFLRGLFKYANQAMPGILQDILKLVDPVQKDLRDMNDYLLQYVPGHGEVANLDAFGRKRMMGYGFSDSVVPNTVPFLSGFNVRPENLDVVDQELLRLGIGVKERTRVRGVQLTAAQRNRMLETAGPEAHKAVESFVNSEMYKELNDNGRSQIIKRLIYQAYDMASARLMMEDEPLRDEIYKTALEERTIKP